MVMVRSLVNNESEIFRQRLTANGAEVDDNDFRISNMGTDGDADYDASYPAVAYSGQDAKHLVVWESNDNTDGEHDIYTQQLMTTGAAADNNDCRTSDIGPDGDKNCDAQHLAVVRNGTDNQYLVVWDGDGSTSPLW